MKYTIEGFSQDMLIKYDMDIIDATILRYFIDFKDSKRMKGKIINDKLYHWVKYDGVIEELPILNLNKPDSVYRRLKRMVRNGILESITIKQGGVYSYYRTGVNYLDLISSYSQIDISPKISDENPNKTDINPTIPDENPNETDKNPEQKTHLLYSSTNNPSTNINKKKINYAEFVRMSEAEYNKLLEHYGEIKTKRMITILDNYKGSSGKSYKSDYRAILSWVVEKVEAESKQCNKNANSNWSMEGNRNYVSVNDIDSIESKLLGWDSHGAASNE